MRLRVSPYLRALLTQGEEAAASLATTDPRRRSAVADAARRESARLSARLDGSPLDDATADAVDARGAALQPVAGGQAVGCTGGWAQALKLDRMATADVAAVEYANLLACFDAEPALAPSLFSRPYEVLVALHEVICRGLVAPAVAGRPRRSAQAVHDGAQGRVVYFPAAPETVEERTDEIVRWLLDGAPLEADGQTSPLLVAGALQERLLEVAPFEAGNGRLARAASRLVLRALGVDPEGVAVPERLLAMDPLGYHTEVAATIRRRGDLGPWMDRYAEAAVAGLEAAADRSGAGPQARPPARAVSACARLTAGEPVTVVDYARWAQVDVAAARGDLWCLTRAGVLTVEPGTRGLKFRKV